MTADLAMMPAHELVKLYKAREASPGSNAFAEKLGAPPDIDVWIRSETSCVGPAPASLR